MKQTIMNIECILYDMETKENLKAQIISTLGVATYRMLGITDLYKVPEVEQAKNVKIQIDCFKDNELALSALNGGFIEFTNITDKNITMPRKIKVKVVSFDEESVENE